MIPKMIYSSVCILIFTFMLDVASADSTKIKLVTNLNNTIQFWTQKECLFPPKTIYSGDRTLLQPCNTSGSEEKDACTIFFRVSMQICLAITNSKDDKVKQKFEFITVTDEAKELENNLCELTQKEDRKITAHATYMKSSSLCESLCIKTKTKRLCALLVVGLCKFFNSKYCEVLPSKVQEPQQSSPPPTTESAISKTDELILKNSTKTVNPTSSATTTTTPQIDTEEAKSPAGPTKLQISSPNTVINLTDASEGESDKADKNVVVSVQDENDNEDKTNGKDGGSGINTDNGKNDDTTKDGNKEKEKDKGNGGDSGTNTDKDENDDTTKDGNKEKAKDKGNGGDSGTNTDKGENDGTKKDGNKDKGKDGDSGINTDKGKNDDTTKDGNKEKAKDKGKDGDSGINTDKGENDDTTEDLNNFKDGDDEENTEDGVVGDPEDQENENKSDETKTLINKKHGETDKKKNTQVEGIVDSQSNQKTVSGGLDEESNSSGHFIAYFLTAVVICVAGYIIFHNKQKIMAFVIEGRNAHRRHQRSKGVKYTELKSNVEEVMPSLEKTAMAKNFVY